MTILTGDYRLLEILIRTSCAPGDLVGDWFAGSGAVGDARRLTDRRFVGCEIDVDMAQRAHDRITAIFPFLNGGMP